MYHLPIMFPIRKEIHTFVLFYFISCFYPESDKTLFLGPTGKEMLRFLCFLVSGS